MNDSLTISIITVTYNAESTLTRTLESVRMQSYPHIEVVLVDGASTDGTLRIADDYQDVITTLISEKDKGIYDAMNKGIAAARGEYLLFLNAGDKLHDTHALSRLAAVALDSHTPDILYSDTAIVDNEGTFLHLREKRPPAILRSGSFKDGMVVCHQAFVVKRLLTVPYDLSYRLSSDFDWCIRMMHIVEKRGGQMVLVPGVLIDYLHEGMTTQNHKASLKERFAIMKKHYGLCTTIVKHIGFVLKQLSK